MRVSPHPLFLCALWTIMRKTWEGRRECACTHCFQCTALFHHPSPIPSRNTLPYTRYLVLNHIRGEPRDSFICMFLKFEFVSRKSSRFGTLLGHKKCEFWHIVKSHSTFWRSFSETKVVLNSIHISSFLSPKLLTLLQLCTSSIFFWHYQIEFLFLCISFSFFLSVFHSSLNFFLTHLSYFFAASLLRVFIFRCESSLSHLFLAFVAFISSIPSNFSPSEWCEIWNEIGEDSTKDKTRRRYSRE